MNQFNEIWATLKIIKNNDHIKSSSQFFVRFTSQPIQNIYTDIMNTVVIDQLLFTPL